MEWIDKKYTMTSSESASLVAWIEPFAHVLQRLRLAMALLVLVLVLVLARRVLHVRLVHALPR